MELYREDQILPMIRKAEWVKESPYGLQPDCEILIAIYDLQDAAAKLESEEKYIFEKVWHQASINEIANAMHTTERTIYRKLDSMVTNLHKTLNNKS